MQRHPISRVVVAATVLATLLIPLVGSTAGPGDDIEENNAEIEAIQDQLDQLSPEYNSRKDKLLGLQKEITQYSLLAHELRVKVNRVKTEVSEITAQIKVRQMQIDEVHGRALEQAVALYKSGSTQILETLFSSTSLSELDTKAAMLSIASEENNGALIKFGRLKTEVVLKNEELLAKKNELAKDLAKQREILDKLAAKKLEAAEQFAKIAGKWNHLKDREEGPRGRQRPYPGPHPCVAEPQPGRPRRVRTGLHLAAVLLRHFSLRTEVGFDAHRHRHRRCYRKPDRRIQGRNGDPRGVLLGLRERRHRRPRRRLQHPLRSHVGVLGQQRPARQPGPGGRQGRLHRVVHRRPPPLRGSGSTGTPSTRCPTCLSAELLLSRRASSDRASGAPSTIR